MADNKNPIKVLFPKMDPKWEPKVLTVSAPGTPKSTLKISSPSLITRIFNSWNNSPNNSPNSVKNTSPLKNTIKGYSKGLELKMEENISDINLDLISSSNDTLNDLVSEFDPIAKDDWMLHFESPIKSNNIVNKPSETPIKSLIDDLIPIATPNSIVKYTQKDLDNLKLELETRVRLIFLNLVYKRI